MSFEKNRKKILKAFQGALGEAKEGKSMSPGTGATGGTRGRGRNPMAQFEGSSKISPQVKANLKDQRDTLRKTISPSTTMGSKITALALSSMIPGAGIVYKKYIDANPPYLRDKTKKINKPNISERDGGNEPSKVMTPSSNIVNTKLSQILPKQNFFPFQAYNSGGVSSGPPPKKGPNSEVPPIKMRNGKLTKTYKMSCPHRPDGIRGVGASIKGHKFTGVK